MQLVERHVIDRHDTRWAAIDHASWLSKNLYNAANYRVRQAFIFHRQVVSYETLDKQMKRDADYCALPRKVSQWVLKQVAHDWQSFLAAQQAWHDHPETFTGRPKMPGYKHKTRGRNLLTYTVQAVSKRVFQQTGQLQPSQLGIRIKTRQASFDQVRILPRKTHYVVEVVYTVAVSPPELDRDRVASIDVGLDNLAAVTFNQPGFAPLLVNGKPLKAINQYYNKERARLQQALAEGQYTSWRLEALIDKRNRRIEAYLHRTSRRLINGLVFCNIGTLVIGKNDGWKQAIALGKRTNQNFVQVPHARFIDMLTYKAELAGIQVVLVEESYTSKCSFLDEEPIGKHVTYAGRRIKRGLFRASDGRVINADVNAAYNIMRKAIPNAFGDGIEAVVVQPVRVTPA
ncbi:MAG: IS200/IS605 family element transposase accessory protein TnpB [Chloroflexi bacterium]|nr:IS200/IS605 family element transposase accessory protein TnpB [Chloroflexota bacterium]